MSIKLDSARGVRTWLEIDRRSLRFNYERFGALARGAPIMAVVKSNAYGHGLVQVAKFLSNDPRIISNDSRIDGFEKNSVLFEKDSRKSLWFGVDSIVEAIALRRQGIRQPILVLGYTLPERYADAARHGVTVTVSSFDAFRAFERVRRRPAVHLKLDTGLHRQGFQEHEIPELIAGLKRSRCEPDGVYSHFAWEENRRFSKRQMACFRRCLRLLSQAGINPAIRHLSRTGALGRYPEANYDLVRVGLGLYGYWPDRGAGFGRLRPVLSWKTVVGEVKRVRNGEGIGYDLIERLRRDTDVAILPIGYWHGFDRGLSGIGEVLIRGTRARVLGRVSMDMTAVDVTDANRALKGRNAAVGVGDVAVIIGRQGRERIGADEVAAKINTTAYEVLTRLNPLIRRIVV